MKAHELLSDVSKFCRGTAAMDAHGEAVGALSETACQWCVLGALMRVYGGATTGEFWAAKDKLSDALRAQGISFVARWSDNFPFNDVRNTLIELDI